MEGQTLKILFKKQKRFYKNVKKILLFKEAFSKMLMLLIKIGVFVLVVAFAGGLFKCKFQKNLLYLSLKWRRQTVDNK